MTEIDTDKLEALRAGRTSLGDPDWTAGCVRLVLEHGQAAVETDDDSIPPGPDCFSAEWITAIHNSAPALLAEIKRLRAEVQRLSTMAFTEADEYVTRMRGTP